jgi:hypothetical protein
MTIMAHTSKTALKGKFEDGDRPIGEDFANLLDSCHNTNQDTDVTITGTITVSGTGTVVGATALKSSLSVGSNLTVSGPTVLNDNISVNGDVYLGKTLQVTSATDLNSTLDVAGEVSLGAQNNPTLVRGVLQTRELATFDKNVHIKGDLRVDGNAYLSAGSTGIINVGDSAADSVDFNADIISDLLPDTSGLFDLGATGQKWKTLYINSVVVDTTVDGRDVSEDGIVLDNLNEDMTVIFSATGGWDATEDIVTPKYTGWDSTKSTVDAGAVSWDTASVDSLANKADLVNVIATSGGWDSTKSTVDTGHAGWTNTESIVTAGHANWDSVKTTVSSLSDTWEETADINEVADDVVNIMAVSADWNNTTTVVQSDSGVWGAKAVADLTDVNTTGLSNNSILRYDDASGEWVISTTEDTRAVGSIQIDDGRGGSVWHNETIVLVDNSDPVNTVTFTADKDTLSGNIVENSNWSYTYGTSGISSLPGMAVLLADAIQFAKSNSDIAVSAEASNVTINLSQDLYGKGGNTNISGTADGSNLITVNSFTGGENPDAFEDLDDTPASYSGHGHKFVKVNNAETGLEFTSHDTAGWDATKATVDAKEGDWDDTRTTVKGFSALWEETVDINEVAADVATIMGVSGEWNTAYTDSQLNESDLVNVMVASGSWDTASVDSLANKADLANVMTTSGSWDTASVDSLANKADFVNVMTTSGSWDTASVDSLANKADFVNVMTASGSWDTASVDSLANKADFANVMVASGSWDTASVDSLANKADLANVMTASGSWDTASVDSLANKADLANVMATSGNWDSVHTSVTDTSANWDSVFTHVEATSTNWETHVHNKNDPNDVKNLTGVLKGDFVIVSGTTPDHTLIALQDDPDGTYNAAGPSYANYELFPVWEGITSINGEVGPAVTLDTNDIGETANKIFVHPDSKASWDDARTTVDGFSAIWGQNLEDLANVMSPSGDWNTAYTLAGTNSADLVNVMVASGSWNTAYTLAGTNSADLVNVIATSGEWDSVYTSSSDTSANWDSVYTSSSETSGNWDSVHSWVNSDSATNNTDYNQTHFVNASGDTITGDLYIGSGDLEVDGLISVASEIQHKDDVSTKIAFSEDVIKLEADGNEYITIDGAGATPDNIIINNSSQNYNFQVKTDNDDYTIYTSGSTDRVGIGTTTLTHKLNVKGDMRVTSDLVVNGTSTLSGNTQITDGDLTVAKSLTVTTGEMVSGSTPLHEIFSTDVDIWNDLTVHGSISAVENTTIDGSLSAADITVTSSISTLTGADVQVSGITTNINIGGHVLHIVNGLIVGVTDE